METKWARLGSLTAARCGGAVLLLCALLLLAGSQVDARRSGGSPGFDPVSPDAQQQHFVLVHGIGHAAWCWYKVITFLRLRGYQVSAVDLTGAGINRVVPAENVTTVAQYTQPLIDLLASLPPSEKVILVGHSLGGGSIAYASELFPDKVSKAVYVAAGSPIYNDSFATSFAPTTFPRLLGSGDLYANFPDGPDQPARSFSLNTTTLRDFFYNTSPLKDYYLALTLITTSPALIVNEVLPLTPQNFGRVPRYYIQTLADFGVATSEQAYIIARNPPLCVFQIPGADHAVFFSKPKPLSRLLIRVSELDPQSGSCRPVTT